MGNLLKDLGVQPEQRVLLVLDDTPAFPAAFLGAMRIGAVPVPVNPLDKAEHFRHYLRDSEAKVAIADASLMPAIVEARGDGKALLIAANGEAEGALPLEEAMAELPAELDPVDSHRDDPAFWLYSSGSTGLPKGVVHLHHDIPYTCDTYAREILQISEADVTYSTTKLFHAYGLGNSLSFPYSVGATTVLASGRSNPARALELAERFKPTLFFSVPALYRAMLDQPAADLSSVRMCVSAAEPLHPGIEERWEERYGVPIVDGIGSTEMLHIYCSNRFGDVRRGTSGPPGARLRAEAARPRRRSGAGRRAGPAVRARRQLRRLLLAPAREDQALHGGRVVRHAATATAWTRMATTSTRAAWTTCSRSAGCGCRPPTWRPH